MARTRRIAQTQIPAPPRVASLAQLIAQVNSQSAAVQSLTALVGLEPSTGSVYSGVIKQYRDVRGFLLVKRPGLIRMTGQAPVLHTDIFDMASDGKRFSVYIPSQNKFYVGDDNLSQKPGKTLENIRPQPILDAFLLEPVDPARASYFLEEVDRENERDYMIGVLGAGKPGPVSLKRKIWFNRTSLEISRVELYGAAGACLEAIQYSDYQDFGSVHYPGKIGIRRPVEDYSLVITLENPQFNQPLADSKFALMRPAGVTVVDLDGAASQPEGSHGQ